MDLKIKDRDSITWLGQEVDKLSRGAVIRLIAYFLVWERLPKTTQFIQPVIVHQLSLEGISLVSLSSPILEEVLYKLIEAKNNDFDLQQFIS